MKVPYRRLHQIENRADFVKAFIFDVWAGSIDVRQALYVEDESALTYKAIFIDHGHLFGGPLWNSKRRSGLALTWDNSIYEGMFNCCQIEEFLGEMAHVIPIVLPRLMAALPEAWRFSGSHWLQEALTLRVHTLRDRVVTEILSISKISQNSSHSAICAHRLNRSNLSDTVIQL